MWQVIQIDGGYWQIVNIDGILRIDRIFDNKKEVRQLKRVRRFLSRLPEAASMIVISNKYLGIIHNCENCTAVFSYKAAEVAPDNTVTCPVCGFRQESKIVYDSNN